MVAPTPVFAEEHCGGLRNRVIGGDALAVSRVLAEGGLAGKVDLVYLDPPYKSQADYVHEARLDGPADGRVRRTLAYEDSWDESGAYLDMLAPRLEALARLLAPTGTLWVHVDWRASYLVRVLLDEIFGQNRFINEIVWRRAPNLGRQAASSQFGRTLDTIVVYGGPKAKLSPPTRLEPIEKGAIRVDDEGRPFTTAPRGDYTDESIAKLEAIGRVHRTSTGRVYVKYFLVKNEEGILCRERRVDALWTDISPMRHAAMDERTGFPTQKPRALLERIIRASTPEDGLVVDLFSGSGTTGEAAHVLGRSFVLGDASPVAIATSRARLLRAGAPFVLERCGAPDGEPLASQPVTVNVTRDVAGDARVKLVSPGEPLAWAVDAAYDERRPFTCGWHSERTPGTKPVPAKNEATVGRVGTHVAVRVYGDDGAVGTVVHPTP